MDTRKKAFGANRIPHQLNGYIACDSDIRYANFVIGAEMQIM